MATIKGGNDIKSGTTAADLIYGYAGNDSLYGKAGADKIWGGPGADKLMVKAATIPCTGKTGRTIFSGVTAGMFSTAVPATTSFTAKGTRIR